MRRTVSQKRWKVALTISNAPRWYYVYLVRFVLTRRIEWDHFRQNRSVRIWIIIDIMKKETQIIFLAPERLQTYTFWHQITSLYLNFLQIFIDVYYESAWKTIFEKPLQRKNILYCFSIKKIIFQIYENRFQSNLNFVILYYIMQFLPKHFTI